MFFSEHYAKFQNVKVYFLGGEQRGIFSMEMSMLTTHLDESVETKLRIEQLLEG